MGALALFGEKYGDEVRVVEVGDYSRELCGGTHVVRSGQLGLVKILGESSIGSGVRRVEALVGTDAFRYLATESLLVSQLSEQLKARREELPERVSALVARVRDAERELDRLRSAQLLGVSADLAGRAEDIGGGWPSSRTRCPTGPAPTGSARSPSTCAAGWATGPRSSWWPASRRTARPSWSRSMSGRASVAWRQVPW